MRLVGAHRVDGLLVGAMDVHQALSKVWVRGEGPGSVLHQLPPGLRDRRFGRIGLPRCLLGGVQGGVRVCGGDQTGYEVLERHPIRSYLDALAVPGGKMAVQPGKATGKGGEHLRVPVAHAHSVQQLVEGYGWIPVQ